MRIAIRDLCKSYGSKKILDNLTLELDGPGIWALIAPNGAGKTTLLDCIANLSSFESGQIQLAGKEHTDPSIHTFFSYLQDNRVLYPELTGLEHLLLVERIQGLPKERLQEIVEEIGISDYLKLPVKQYSLGMKQHLLLAIGMMNNPKILLLDEPLNGLDPTSYIQTRKLLQKLAQKGSTIILSSHQLNEVDLLTDQLLFLKDGKIIQRRVEKTGRRYAIYTTDNQKVDANLGKLEGLSYENEAIHVDTNFDTLHHYLEEILSCQVQILDIVLVGHHSETIYKELFE